MAGLYNLPDTQVGDIWHWKLVRNLGQIDDQYLDWTRYDAENSPEAGLKSEKRIPAVMRITLPASLIRTTPAKPYLTRHCPDLPPLHLTLPPALLALSWIMKR
jgi:hypothetical protein